MKHVKILSFNVRGLRNRLKRTRVFNTLKKNNFDIICLQETYITKHDYEQWKKEWGGDLIFYEGTNHGRGQVTLLRKNFPYDYTIDILEDRIIVLTVKAEKEMCILNAYAPCGQRETKNFIAKTNNIVNDLTTELKIICGDFNTVLSNEKDVISGELHSQSLVDAFNDFVIDSELNDIWRIYNSNSKEYTWSRMTRGRFVARRLDYMLLNDNAVNKTSKTEIFSTPYSDHRGVMLEVQCTDTERGPGFYKFNNQLLEDKMFLSTMNKTLSDFLSNNQHENPELKLELLKIEAREKSIQYSKQKALQKRNIIANLYKDLNNAEKALSNDPENFTKQHNCTKLKLELDIIEQERLKSAKFRSKQLWIDQGEKPTKYFLNLEKHRAGSKLLPNLQLENGTTVTDQFEILKAQRKYFEELYNKEPIQDNIDTKVDRFLRECEVTKLSETDKNSCEGLITIEEASIALKMMKNGSSPGLDGLTTEFFKCFWGIIGNVVVDSFNESYQNGTLSFTQSSAGLTLIHKGKDLPRNILKNWRPISLTNTDYKILAKCLANRACKVIEKIVTKDQVGYIKGRNISTTIRTIDDIIEYWNLKDRPGILLALDFQKAFDSISKQFMLCAFRKFGFGTDFLQWVSTLFKNTRSCIIYNGWVSESFDVRCGIRQGCPFSPLAFIIGVELLAIRFRANNDVNGLTLDIDQILKVLLYADDITVFVEQENDVHQVLNIIKEFTLISGLNLNMNKSEIMGIGSSKNRRFNCGMKWVNEIKILGIHFSNNTCASMNRNNWDNKIVCIKKLIAQWEKRDLGLLGKVCVVKSFMLSQFVHTMKSICIPDHVLKDINTLLFRFLWRKKDCNKRAFEKVKRVVVNADIDRGGIKMIDIKTMQESFLCMWISNILKQTSLDKWTWVPKKHLQYFGKEYACLSSTVGPVKFKGLTNIKSTFWKKAITTWLYINKNAPRNADERICIWNNEKITYQGNVLFFRSWTHKITFMSDIVNNNVILSFDTIERLLGPSASLLLEYITVRAAITHFIYSNENNIEQQVNDSLFNNECAMTAKSFRALIVKLKYVEPCASRFWKNKLNIDITERVWNIPYLSTKESRLRELQWKILHNIYPTNILLLKMGLRDSNVCLFCKGSIDFVEHFFFYCPNINNLWGYISNYIRSLYDVRITFSAKDVLIGIIDNEEIGLSKDQGIVVNHLILIGKMIISKYKYGTALNLEIMLSKELRLRKFVSFT